MEHLRTVEVIEAITDRIRASLAGVVGHVFAFDGSLAQAVRDHLQQPTVSGAKSLIFLAISDDVPHSISGSGKPIQSDYIIDIWVLVVTDGRERYTSDRARLYDISDRLVFDTFDSTDPGYRKYLASETFMFRRRGDVQDPSFMAHMVRWQFNPQRAR